VIHRIVGRRLASRSAGVVQATPNGEIEPVASGAR
jgi:hypothetical protein